MRTIVFQRRSTYHFAHDRSPAQKHIPVGSFAHDRDTRNARIRLSTIDALKRVSFEYKHDRRSEARICPRTTVTSAEARIRSCPHSSTTTIKASNARPPEGTRSALYFALLVVTVYCGDGCRALRGPPDRYLTRETNMRPLPPESRSETMYQCDITHHDTPREKESRKSIVSRLRLEELLGEGIVGVSLRRARSIQRLIVDLLQWDVLLKAERQVGLDREECISKRTVHV